jgi:hypothetical protein
VELAASQVEGWIDRFVARHGEAVEHDYVLTAADGTVATVSFPYFPVREGAVAQAVATSRTIAVVLVRGGAHSVGIVRDGAVLASTTDRHQLNGRTAAGGWSQQRFARRRGNQVRQGLEHAVSDIRRVLLPRCEEFDSVVFGGDKLALTTIREPRDLAVLWEKLADRHVDVGQPRRVVLDEVAKRVTGVEILLADSG